MKFVFCILGLISFFVIMIVCINKFGREKVISFVIKVISPISIVLFYFCDFSIIDVFINLIGVDSPDVLNVRSSKVAIDSALLTLIFNVMILFFVNPIKINVDYRNSQMLKEVVTYCQKQVHVEYTINVDFGRKWLKKLFIKYGGVKLAIINSENTTIAIDKEEEYAEAINGENSSKQIIIDFCKLFNSEELENKIYLDMLITSNKTVKWDDVITCKIITDKKILKLMSYIFLELKQDKITVVHRKEDIC